MLPKATSVPWGPIRRKGRRTHQMATFPQCRSEFGPQAGRREEAEPVPQPPAAPGGDEMSGKRLLRREAALQQAAAAAPQGTHCSSLLPLRRVLRQDSLSPSLLCPPSPGESPSHPALPQPCAHPAPRGNVGRRAALEHQRSEGDPGAVGMGTSAHPQAAGRGRDVCSGHARCPAAARSQHRGLGSNGCDRGKHKKWLISRWAEKEVAHRVAGLGKGLGVGRKRSRGPGGAALPRASSGEALWTSHPWALWDLGEDQDGQFSGQGGTAACSFSTQGCLSPWAEPPRKAGTGEGWQPLALLSSTCTRNAASQRDLGVQAGSSSPDTVTTNFCKAQRQLEAKQGSDRPCICLGRDAQGCSADTKGCSQQLGCPGPAQAPTLGRWYRAVCACCAAIPALGSISPPANTKSLLPA